MPKKITDTDGNTHEVLTQEEVDKMVSEKEESIKEEVKKEFQESLKEKEEEAEKIKTELESAKEALDDEDEETKDWAKMRTTVKELQKKLEEAEKSKEELKEEFSSEIRNVRTSLFKNKIDTMIENLSNGDEEVEKKIRHHFERLGDVENEKDAQKQVKDAYLLATGNNAPNPINVAMGAPMGGSPEEKSNVNKELSEVSKNFGLSDEDIEKYSSKAKEKKQKHGKKFRAK